MDAISQMEIGQIVDYIIEYNKLHDYEGSGNSKTPTKSTNKRKATQADWDALCG